MATEPKKHRLPPTRGKVHRVSNASDQRPNSYRRGYGRRWAAYSRQFRRRNPLCVVCGAVAEHVDHVEAVSGPNDPLFWEESNHRALCHSCHSRKTVKSDGGFGRRPRRVEY